MRCYGEQLHWQSTVSYVFGTKTLCYAAHHIKTPKVREKIKHISVNFGDSDDFLGLNNNDVRARLLTLEYLT